MEYNHILVATDLSDNSRTILTKAQDLATAYHSKTTLLHVIEVDPSAEHIYVDQDDYRARMMDLARERIANECAMTHFQPDHQQVEFGSPRKIISEIAQSKKIDLIIVGSHGRHGWQLLLGSTANSVVHRSLCDVCVVRLL